MVEGIKAPAPVVGIVLAGGKSSRFGSNKALQPIQNECLIQKVIEQLDGLFEGILVVTNRPESYAFLRCSLVKDRIEGLGPLGGIYTALRQIYPCKAFVFPCDMPLLNRDLIRYMLEVSRDGYDILVPQVGEGLYEPLHAIYGPKCIPAIEELIAQNRLRIFYLYSRVRVRYVKPEEIRSYDPELSCFLNINTREELNRFLSPKEDKTKGA